MENKTQKALAQLIKKEIKSFNEFISKYDV
jgi:hypothetical protein